jgi:hypothetical protein
MEVVYSSIVTGKEREREGRGFLGALAHSFKKGCQVYLLSLSVC